MYTSKKSLITRADYTKIMEALGLPYGLLMAMAISLSAIPRTHTHKRNIGRTARKRRKGWNQQQRRPTRPIKKDFHFITASKSTGLILNEV